MGQRSLTRATVALLPPGFRRRFVNFLRALGVPVPGWPPGYAMNVASQPLDQMDFPLAYKLVASVNFCVSLLQETIAALPLQFCVESPTTGDRTPIPYQPDNIVGIWKTGNSETTGYDLIEQLVGSLLIHGNAFLFKDYAGTSRVQQFWILPPLDMSPVAGPGRTVAGWRLRMPGGRTIEIPKQQIVHIPRFDPDLGILGVSPLTAVRLQYETERDRNQFARSFYGKGGTVSGYYSTEEPLDVEEREELEVKLRHRFQGPENAWDPVILPSKLKYERGGLTMQEMQFIDSHRLTLMDILMVYKIPAPYASIFEGSGLNSDVIGASALMFHENAVKPICERIAYNLNEKLLADGSFGPNVECYFDYSGVLALQKVFLDQAQAYEAACGGPVMTRAEAREKLGLSDLADPELEAVLTPSNQLPAMSEAQPQQQPPPAAYTTESRGIEQARARGARALKVHERQVERGFRRIFSRQQSRVVALIGEQLRLTKPGRRAIDMNQLLSMLDRPSDQRSVRNLIEGIVRNVGDEALVDLGIEAAYDITAGEVATFIRDKALKAITRVNSTTREQLRQALADGVLEGEGLNELTARVRDVFKGRRANAATIARTETAGAYNFATTSAWGQSGVVASKRWLTAQDEAVRESHRSAEGQTVPLGGLFLVGGVHLAYPGDPGGPADEIINCRCQIVPVLAQAQRGAPDRPASTTTSRNGNRVAPPSLEDLFSCSK